jgi:hypothetical protein
MPYDLALADEMRDALRGRPGITERKMFGGICWMLNGNMLCGVDVGRYMLRVGPAREAQALAELGATPMDITGRPMRGIVWVDAGAAAEVGLSSCLALATAFVGSLPAK